MAAAEKPGGVAAAPTIALGPGRISQDLMDWFLSQIGPKEHV